MNPPLVVRLIAPVLAILLAVVHWFIPRRTRPDLFFAVTVMPGFRDSTAGSSILRRYRQGVVGVSAVAMVLTGALAWTSAFRLAPLGLLVQLAALFGVFYSARRLVLPHTAPPTTIRQARTDQRGRRIPGGWLIASGPFVLLAACAGYLAAHWQQIPARVVLHWDARGQPDRWAARTPERVFFPLAVGAVVLLAMTLILYGTAHWLRSIYAGGPEAEHESRFRRTVMSVFLVVEYWIVVLASWLALRPLLPPLLQRPSAVFAFLPGLITLAGVAIFMWLGQGGSGMSAAQRQMPDSSRPVGDRTEDRFWKLGVFYFNRNDPAVMVEKRFGIGYTMNFAHPVSWLIFLLLLVPVAFTLIRRVR